MPTQLPRETRLHAPRLAGLILLIAGLGLVAFTVLTERRQERTFAGALHTSGRVVAVLPRHDAHGSVSYAPLVRYRTNQGVQVDFTSSRVSHAGVYTAGQAVPVVYSPLNPQQAEIDSWSARWLLTTLYGALAIVFIGLGSTAVLRRGAS